MGTRKFKDIRLLELKKKKNLEILVWFHQPIKSDSKSYRDQNFYGSPPLENACVKRTAAVEVLEEARACASCLRKEPLDPLASGPRSGPLSSEGGGIWSERGARIGVVLLARSIVGAAR